MGAHDAETVHVLPEYHLYAAILRRAILDYVLYRDHDVDDKKRLSAAAAVWIRDEAEDLDADGRVPFLFICDLLGLDAQEVRLKVLALRREDLHRAERATGAA